MAFYQNAPDKKKGKINYAEKGSWDEEGTHYSDRDHKPARTADKKFSRGNGKNSNHFGTRFHDGEVSRFESKGNRRFDRNESRGQRNEGYEEKSNEFRRFDKQEHSHGDSVGHRYSGNAMYSARKESFSKDRSFTHNDHSEEFTADQSYRAHEYRAETSGTQAEEDLGANILCGRNPIREALKNERDIEKLLVQKGELSGSAREIVQIAKERKIPVQEVDKQRLDDIAKNHQGLVAYASAYQYSTVDEMLSDADERNEAPFLIILDGITDPHNLGAIIRTADCVGAHGVIVPTRRSVGLTPAAVKASAGAVEHVKVARVTNITRLLDELKEMNIWTYAVTMNGKNYEKMDFSGGTALVIGAEGEGISRLTEEHCDCAVSLPMSGHIDSLNASVAAGVMMYRVYSCRNNKT